MNTPQLDPSGNNSHRSTNVIMIAICGALIVGSICGVLNMVSL